MYTEEQYNNFGWASYNGVITALEREKLLSLYADYKHNKHKYPTTRFGEAVIASSTEKLGVIMYVKGPISNPKITKIVRIDTILKPHFFTIQEALLKNERERRALPLEIVEHFFGQKIFTQHRCRNYKSFLEYRVESDRKHSKEADTDSGELKDGRGSTEQNQKSDRSGEDDALTQNLLYSVRPEKSMSNRHLLANALESTIDTSTKEGEKQLKALTQYKNKMKSLEVS